jgi:hypothetical protein
MCNCNTGARSQNYGCSGLAISITYSECVSVALAIRYAKRTRRIILSCGPSGSTTFFSLYLINDMTFGGKKLLNTKKCVLSLHLLSITSLILRLIRRDTIINVDKFSCRVPVTFVTL